MFQKRIIRTMGAAVLAVAPAGIAETDLPSIAFAAKGGGHYLEDPRTAEHEVRPYWELEIETPGLWGGPLSLTASLAGTHFDSSRDHDAWSVDDVDYAQSIKHEYDLQGGRLGLRWRPCPHLYATAGGGYFQYTQETASRTTATWFDPDLEDTVIDTTESTRHKRKDHGFYPFVALGGEWPIGEYSSLIGQTYLLIEGQYAFDPDFGGPMLVAGLRFRW